MQGCVQGKTAEKSRTASGSENRKGYAQNGQIRRKGHRKGRTERGRDRAAAIEPIERLAFYDEGKTAYAIVATGENALYTSSMLQKGVVIEQRCEDRSNTPRTAYRLRGAGRVFCLLKAKSPPTSICAMFVGGSSCRLPAFALCDAGIEPDVRRDGGALCALLFRLLTRSSIRS